MFKEDRNEQKFNWSMIGDIGEGRPNLGGTTEVAVYRLMQFTLRDVIIQRFGVEAADKVFYLAGEEAGREFCKNMLDVKAPFNEFIKQLQEKLKDLRVGLLRIEAADLETLNITLTVAEDLDCSGLPVCEETICTYDEGFIAGVLSEYTGRKFDVREIDCWCSGDRVCRFDIKPAEAA